ncbi:hypothetical protein LCGC14_1220700 [marine sediment metagenome]|uniref:Uncharacterized protein n=1 Tax=marine sediment metagenome TaxID=412755 RepID=A0A0F9LBB8_9ZZZZ
MAYTDLATMKAQLDFTDSGQDTILAVYVVAAGERCDKFTGRVYGDNPGEGFESHTRAGQVHQLAAVSRVVLREWPVISVTTITLDGVAQVAGTDYRIDLRIGVITFIDSAGYEARVSGVLLITFVAGFAAAPSEVEMCCLRLGSYWFNRKATEGLGSQLIGDLQESFRRPEESVILNDTIGHYRLCSVG